MDRDLEKIAQQLESIRNGAQKAQNKRIVRLQEEKRRDLKHVRRIGGEKVSFIKDIWRFEALRGFREGSGHELLLYSGNLESLPRIKIFGRSIGRGEVALSAQDYRSNILGRSTLKISDQGIITEHVWTGQQYGRVTRGFLSDYALGEEERGGSFEDQVIVQVSNSIKNYYDNRKKAEEQILRELGFTQWPKYTKPKP